MRDESTRESTIEELLQWLAKTCEERYPYRNGETYHENWRPTDDAIRPVGYGVLRRLQKHIDSVTEERERLRAALLGVLDLAAMNATFDEDNLAALKAADVVEQMRGLTYLRYWEDRAKLTRGASLVMHEIAGLSSRDLIKQALARYDVSLDRLLSRDRD